MGYGDIDVSNKEIIEFQDSIDVDIGVILDIPTAEEDYDKVRQNVALTTERAKEAQQYINDKRLWCGPVQGSIYTDLLKESAAEMSKLNFDIHPLGSVVPYLMRYKYKEHVNLIIEAKRILPADRPVHLFGAGHPMFFAFAVGLGIDLFDSAAYALFAKQDRYITVQGTLKIHDIEYLPCSCPVCVSTTAKELRQLPDKERELALSEHNLYVTFGEINAIKQAIVDGTLWELIEQRAKAHPSLYAAKNTMERRMDYMDDYDPYTKRHFFDLSRSTQYTPQAKRAKARIESIKGVMTFIPKLGEVPRTLANCFPFQQFVTTEDFKLERERDKEKMIRDVSRYWFGIDVFPKKISIILSPKTKKIREVRDENNALLATVRATDYLMLPHAASIELHKTKYPRVMIDTEVSEFILEGKSVFAKHVKKVDDKIVYGMPVLVVDENNRLLASGEAKMSSKEMRDFDSGVAVDTRWANPSGENRETSKTAQRS